MKRLEKQQKTFTTPPRPPKKFDAMPSHDGAGRGLERGTKRVCYGVRYLQAALLELCFPFA
jgi:hypothetical protein